MEFVARRCYKVLGAWGCSWSRRSMRRPLMQVPGFDFPRIAVPRSQVSRPDERIYVLEGRKIPREIEYTRSV